MWNGILLSFDTLRGRHPSQHCARENKYIACEKFSGAFKVLWCYTRKDQLSRSPTFFQPFRSFSTTPRPIVMIPQTLLGTLLYAVVVSAAPFSQRRDMSTVIDQCNHDFAYTWYVTVNTEIELCLIRE